MFIYKLTFISLTSEIGHIQYFRKQLTDIETRRIIEATDQADSHRSIGKGFKHQDSTISR